MEEKTIDEAQKIQDEKLADVSGGAGVIVVGPIICELGAADKGEGTPRPNASHIPAANVLP